MKIQLASDLHLELLVKQFPRTRVIEPSPEAGLLVLAGDVHGATKAIDVFGHWPVPVLYVAGNHEFYSECWEATRVAIREAAAGTSVRFLDNDALELGGVRFLGCTLWTDFKLPGASQNEWMQEVGRGLNDYLVIRTQRGRLRPYQTLEDHEQSRVWLEAELAKPFKGKTVVVTHHGSHPMSIHPRYAGDRLNAGFVSDLTPLLHGADLWLHGHVHDSVDRRMPRGFESCWLCPDLLRQVRGYEARVREPTFQPTPGHRGGSVMPAPSISAWHLACALGACPSCKSELR